MSIEVSWRYFRVLMLEMFDDGGVFIYGSASAGILGFPADAGRPFFPNASSPCDDKYKQKWIV